MDPKLNRSKLEEIFYKIEEERRFSQRTAFYVYMNKTLKEAYKEISGNLQKDLFSSNPILARIPKNEAIGSNYLSIPLDFNKKFKK